MKSKTFKKIAIGVAVIAAAAVVTVATGGAAAGTLLAAVHCVASGALAGAIVGAATGAAIGAAQSALTNRSKRGTWKGSGKAAVSGAANGFMKGSITGAIAGGISGAGSIAKASNLRTKVATNPKYGIKNNPNQTAVLKLAKEYKKGISRSDANQLYKWANEYGVPARIDLGHPSGKNAISQGIHMHIGSVNHIPIFPG